MKMWHRLALTNGAVIIATLLVFGTIVTARTIGTLQAELDRRAQLGAQLVARQVETIVRSVEYGGNTLVVMSNQRVAEVVERSNGLSLEDRVAIENRLSFVMSVFPAIAHAWLLLPDGTIVENGRLAGYGASIPDVAQRVLRPGTPMGPNNLSGHRNMQLGPSVFMLAKRMIDIPTGRPIASLILAADAESFTEALEGTDSDLRARFQIVDDTGPVVGTDPQSPSPGNVSEFLAPVMGTDWHVRSRVDRDVVRAYTARVVGLSVVVLLAVSSLATAMALVIARTLTRPLEALEFQMRDMDVESGLSHLTAPGTWEVQRVTDGANRLLERVHNLVERVGAEERERQRYHFELLQAQIKPHFLYNALETIHMLGESGRIRRAQRALRALGEFYRLSLSSGREMVSIAQELRLTESYLFVQHLRYTDQFTYTVDADGAHMETVVIPKLTIQPLVENAIYHGIKGLEHPAQISVCAEADAGGTWRIAVRDTGRGMNASQLERLRRGESDRTSFGFFSVVERLRLHLGRAVSVHIESDPGHGTTVEIRGPAPTKPPETQQAGSVSLTHPSSPA